MKLDEARRYFLILCAILNPPAHGAGESKQGS